MKVTLTTKTNLDSPHLEIDVNLEKNIVNVRIIYTCPNCSGYGCGFNGPCDTTKHLAPEDVISTLGSEARPMLENIFKKILGE